MERFNQLLAVNLRRSKKIRCTAHFNSQI